RTDPLPALAVCVQRPVDARLGGERDLEPPAPLRGRAGEDPRRARRGPPETGDRARVPRARAARGGERVPRIQPAGRQGGRDAVRPAPPPRQAFRARTGLPCRGERTALEGKSTRP